MKRRKALQTIALGTMGSSVAIASRNSFASPPFANSPHAVFQSQWHQLPDMVWLGPEYWANRLQDWQIVDGKLECLKLGPNRNVHWLTHQISNKGEVFSMSVRLQINEKFSAQMEGVMGFSVGLKGNFPGYQSACITGKGIEVGVDSKGRLVVGPNRSEVLTNIETLTRGVRLQAKMGEAELELSLFGPDEKELGRFTYKSEAPQEWTGNVALLVHHPDDISEETEWKVRFAEWQISGDKVLDKPDQLFGPICFTQYTLEQGILKLTAQLTPLDPRHTQVTLSIHRQGNWQQVSSQGMRSDSRTSHFRLENWDEKRDCLFRVTVSFPDRQGKPLIYTYEGTIAAEPVDKNTLVAMAMSCNGDFGFPDSEVVVHGLKHDPDVILFLGDQIYERNGGYGVQNDPPYLKADLDFLRKWYLFGWSYRDLFRNRPSICLPDDHDVFHGNVWGEGGEKTIQEGSAKEKQDSGGYKLPADWVNMIQICQTSHMPDPYDPTPIKQGIGVYYTGWKYGGIDFAIIEDRKFKSAPKNYFPDEADVENGFAQNLKFDFKNYQEPEVLQLLGDRQMQFLKEWTEDWTGNIHMKALLSATSFMTLQTLPEGTINDSVTSRLEIPEKGEYVQGDDLTRDMDSNGWPVARRNEVVSLLRKSHAVHIVGDQHLPSVGQYAVDEFGDGSFVFTVPALGNVFPRRWWPPKHRRVRPFLGRPDYTGDFFDGFGNKITVFAAASPYRSHRTPALLYDRSTGYGIVKFDKSTRKIKFECWPRYTDPETQKEGQYADWPIEINQSDNFGYTSGFQLATIQVTGLDLPVLKIYDASSGELISAIRMTEQGVTPRVPKAGKYTARIGNPDANIWKELTLVTTDQPREVNVSFG